MWKLNDNLGRVVDGVFGNGRVDEKIFYQGGMHAIVDFTTGNNKPNNRS